MFKLCQSKAGKKLTRAEQKQLRPAQILDAAFTEFVKNGYAATRVEDIAKHVGVTKGTVYVYFETKEILFEATIRHASTSFADIIKHTNAHEGTPAERLRSLLAALYAHLRSDSENREVLKLIISEGQKFPDIVARHEQHVFQPLMDRVTELVKEGAAIGELRDDYLAFPELIISPLMTLAVLRIIFDERLEMDMDAYFNAHLDLLMNGLLVKKGGEA
ncbi:TetR/AcrR family transcriptional regulator [Agrobacterium larrymoorei]|uniref:AcrR family transcriptional regulator n=1 Tax=Agrobacterium larrymoorei TaxID=160699 RepID=A0ABU0UQP0_9HYPH|nr:TetR/AcrR family transcriptional regulator [Agrobacterium larrymoorei]MDQ1187058.1 AcrR family transcriptional regulator [Agrobacterium larrymoorei]